MTKQSLDYIWVDNWLRHSISMRLSLDNAHLADALERIINIVRREAAKTPAKYDFQLANKRMKPGAHGRLSINAEDLVALVRGGKLPQACLDICGTPLLLLVKYLEETYE